MKGINIKFLEAVIDNACAQALLPDTWDKRANIGSKVFINAKKYSMYIYYRHQHTPDLSTSRIRPWGYCLCPVNMQTERLPDLLTYAEVIASETLDNANK